MAQKYPQKSRNGIFQKIEILFEKYFRIKIEYVLLSAIMLFALCVRLRLLAFPLERDEGEYAYIGSLILDGIAPYKEAYNMKFPGTYFMYAFNMLIFGETTIGVHLGLIFTNLLTILFLFLFTRKLMGASYAVIAATIFALTSLSDSVLGFAAHATHFVMLPAIAGLFLTYSAFEKNKITAYLIAGFVLGCAPIMKQSGIFFPIAGGILLLVLWIDKYGHSEIKQFLFKTFVYFLGGLLPFILTALYLLYNGVWEKFIFWTITYASDYGNQMSASEAWISLKVTLADVSNTYKFFWILSVPGLFAGFFVPGFRIKSIFILVFSVLSFASVSLGFYFRMHYYIQYLPALALSWASLFYAIEYHWPAAVKMKFKWIVLGLVAAWGINAESNYLFKYRVNRLCNKIYTNNPFVESIELSKFIKENTSENDRIAIMGSEPEILFYSGRRSATGYIYTYSLMEKHPASLKMQQEMAAEIEKNKPSILVMVNFPHSWIKQPDSETYIFDWYINYKNTNGYKVVAVADHLEDGGYNFVTGSDLMNYSVQSSQYIVVLKK